MFASIIRHGEGLVRMCLMRVALMAMLALIASVTQITAAAAQAGFSIENVATVDYMVDGGPRPTLTSAPAILFVQLSGTDSELVLLRHAPADPGAVTTRINGADVSVTGERDGPFRPQQPPRQSGGTPIVTTSPVPLADAQSVVASETVFIQVSDPGADLNPGAIDTALVVVTVSLTGDQETLVLHETGPDTGVFVGYAQTFDNLAARWGDGKFAVLADSVITARYQDSFFPDDISTDSAVVDPYGRIFDSTTGAMIDRAQITLIDADTGLPAEVLGIDGVSAYPSTVTSGEPVIDSGGFVYESAPGQFRFPIVAPGHYFLEVTPPGSYAAPSTMSDSALQLLPGGPWVLNSGSRGQMSELTTGPAVRVDIPLDLGSNLQLVKTASHLVAGTGDFIRYELALTNGSGAATTPLTVVDMLPYGFRFQEGSLMFNRAKAQSEVSSGGGVLTFMTPAMGAGERIEITYVVEVTVAAQVGEAVNSAIVRGDGGLVSNIAEAAVRVVDEFMRDTTAIVGRVSAQACDPTDAWPRRIVEGESVAGARVYMEDGTFSVTDIDGQFHFEGLTPGTHVVQIDAASLPEGYEPVLCEENTRVGGRPTSQMVDLQGGSLWRTDFYLKRNGAIADAPVEVPSIELVPEAERSEALIGKYDGAWLARQNGDVEWVYPDVAGGVPFPGVDFAVKHASDQEIAVLLEGKPISALHIAGSTSSADGAVTITHWRGIDIRNGPNTFTVIAKDASGRETARFDRVVHYVNEAARAELVPGLSVLEANGRTEPVVAIRITDAQGRPVHRGRLIEVEVAPPQRAAVGKERFDASPLTAGNAAGAGVIVGDDGVALVRLVPTARSGAVRLSVKLDSANGGRTEKTIDTWLKSEQRDWILVGLAEGTAAFNTVSGNMTAGGGDDISTDGRVAFFAKGTIKGEWLLTISVDTDRDRDDEDEKIFRQIDPDAHHTLYGDATEQDYEAESRYPLYLRVERQNFYAMFGDYDSDMNQTELARYERRLSGMKVAYHDQTFDVIAFGAETNQAFVKDEIVSNGTSGPYRLDAIPVVRNSEQITIETRDRFRNDIVLSTRILVRYLDYGIDYDAGIVTLNQPVPVTDNQFNPNVLSIEYETLETTSRSLTYGGRAAVTLADGRVEVGASYVHESETLDAPDSASDLGGVDVRIKLTDKDEIRAEYARSDTTGGGSDAKGDAVLLEATHEGEDLTAHAYFRQEDGGFGLDQQSVATSTVRRYGVDGSYVLRRAAPDESFPGATSLNVETFREESLDASAARTVAEATVGHLGQQDEVSFGLRYIDYAAGGGQESATITQAISGASHRFETVPLTLFAISEVALDGTSDNDFDSRLFLGGDYRVNEWLSLNASYEYGQASDFEAQNIRAGIAATPWARGTVALSGQNQMGLSENGDRLAATVGVSQSVALTDKLSATAGVERQTMLSGDDFTAANAPFTDALLAEDFTVANVGLGYAGDGWSASTLVEGRDDDHETRLTLNTGLTGDLTENLIASAWFTGTQSRPEDDGKVLNDIDLGLAAAYRPLDRGPIYLNRLDLSFTDGSETGNNSRIVDNFTSNFRLSERGQASLHVGAKYAMADFDGQKFDGFSYFVGGELRVDVTRKFDLGFHGGAAQSLNSGLFDYAFGASVGYNVFENAWFSLGYNLDGLDDDDFGDANFTAGSYFMQFRFNFDHDTLRAALTALRGR
jgi:uncharacterized repeat protein (TIGR01451 family)